jgi:cytochrome c-type biogenesis protein CcmH/NrfG
MTSADDRDRYRMLLRQLRDLDDDVAAGKLTADDHARLSEPVMRAAAAASRQPHARERDPRPDVPSRPPPRRRRSRRIASAVVVGAAAAGVAVALVGAAAPRGAHQQISGDAPAAATSQPAAVATLPAPSASAQPTLSVQQAAAIAVAVAAVKKDPKDVTAHVGLARAYADGGATQLAAIEYLAVTRLDPANAEANTALALLAFEVGQTAQGKQLVDTALAAHPDYPEARYVRALILLMGLHQPSAAIRDLHAYLALAPFGAHRTAAQTLLALAGGR